ncbi:MAG: T9SS type A sorting domain-containing protein [Saprospiraceae bacterium]|nr:T9SS type A sorting domain-containing protein [Saprospiraceae bacterium]
MVSRTTIPLVLGIWLSCLSTLPAQDLNLALQSDFFSFANVVTPVEGDQWLVGGEVGRFYGFPAFSPYLAMIDGQGNLIWEKRITNILGTERGLVNKIIPTIKGTFLVLGEASGCDYGLPGFIAEYDIEGNQLSFKEVFEVGQLAVQLPSGDLLSGHPQWSNFGRVDLDEGLIWEQQLYFSHQFRLRDLALSPDGQAYALGERWLFQFDPEEGEILVDIPIEAGVKLLSLKDQNGIWLLQEEKLQRFDAELELIREIELNSNIEYYALQEINEEIYLMGRNANQETAVLVYDENLDPLREFNVMDRHFLVEDLAYRNGELIFVGNKIAGEFEGELDMYYGEWPFRVKGSHIFTQAFDTVGQRVENQLDIAVEGISYQGTPTPEELGYDCQSISFPEVEVKIENKGEEVLEEVSLNSRFNRCQGICASAFTYFYTFENLNLAPGESISLPVGDIHAPGIPEQDEVELCFWISKPNGKIDSQGANDISCQRLLINDVSDVGEKEGLSLFPNPTTRLLNLDMDQGLRADQEGRIYNTLGQVLHTFIVPQGINRKQLDIQHLAPGSYYLSLGDHNKKFIKY